MMDRRPVVKLAEPPIVADALLAVYLQRVTSDLPDGRGNSGRATTDHEHAGLAVVVAARNLAAAGAGLADQAKSRSPERPFGAGKTPARHGQTR